MSQRLPPHDLEAERAVLGCVLLDPAAGQLALGDLRSEDFFEARHALIFASMAELSEIGRPIDSVAIAGVLRSNGQLERVGGLPAIVGLPDAVASAANLEHYVATVRERATVRRLMAAASTVVAQAPEAASAAEAIDSAERAILEVGQSQARAGLQPIAPLIATAFRRVEELHDARQALTGLPTGIHSLDRMLLGLQPSDLVIVAARPSIGKTAFAMGLAVHAAKEAGAMTAVFSLEMSKEQLSARMLSSEGRIDGNKIRSGALDSEDWPLLARAAGRLSELPMWIDDTGAASVLEVRAKCRRLAAERGLGLVVIDYLQLMRSGSKTQSTEQETAEISKALKGLAKELRVPVVALSQLNRGLEHRTDKRPVLSDLRASGSIEQDADVVMFLYRDEVYNPETSDRGVAEIIVGKQRNGPIGTARAVFQGACARFDSMVDDEPSAQM